MKLSKARVRNFRCLENVDIGFAAVSTLIGPNGVGKSTVLRALDWFFNGGSLSPADVSSGAEDAAVVEVTVEFADLTDEDLEALRSMGLSVRGPTWTVIRRWDGSREPTTSALDWRYPGFTEIRSTVGAVPMRAAYKTLREKHPELGLPAATSQTAVHDAFAAWEAANGGELEQAEVQISHPFGFGTGAAFSGLFDYVLIDADLRAEEQSVDNKGSLISRILAHRVDRGPAGSAFAELATTSSARHAQIVAEHLDPLLSEVSEALTSELSEFTHARRIKLRGSAPAMTPVKPSITLAIGSDDVETSVDRQGHGFRRALLIALLRFLAGQSEATNHTVVLAIEEPELFQHPSQARVFARTLRELSLGRGYQIAYATHSPYFIEPTYFDQVRRLTVETDIASGERQVVVRQVSLERVIEELDGVVKLEGIKSRWPQVCTVNLAEALFAEAVVVVEGSGDVGVIEGIARRERGEPLEDLGIVVADAHGKAGLLIPVAILRGLGIPLIAVYDSDRGVADRVARKAKGQEYVDQAVQSNADINTGILNYFGASPTDPLAHGRLASDLFALDDTLETVLAGWPEWDVRRHELIAEGRGAPHKNAATYALTTAEADGAPPSILVEIIDAARQLVGHVIHEPSAGQR